MTDTPLNFLSIDRHWFLTWTTYGSWLPGDQRGFVGTERVASQVRRINNQPNTQPSKPNARLAQFAARQLKAPVVLLQVDQAHDLLDQFQETVTHRQWLLIAVGVMRTHLHVVVGVTGDPDPDGILRDFKSYGSRKLNRSYRSPASETWWTESGSKRKLSNAASVEAAVNYVRQQPNPFLIWTREHGVVFDAKTMNVKADNNTRDGERGGGARTRDGERGGVSPPVVLESRRTPDSMKPGG